MNVFLEKFGDSPPWHDQHLRMQELAAMDEIQEHGVTADRESADLILAVVNDDVLLHRFPRDDRIRVFCTSDLGFPWIPGVYPSLPRWNADSRYALSGPYLPQEWEYTPAIHSGREPEFLFSFVGSSKTSPIRRRVLDLKHPRAFLKDTLSADAYKSAQPQSVYREFRNTYRNQLAQSKFVLCPRGVGANSIRLFETMRVGRVPVIISDAFEPPEGVPWEAFSIRIPEVSIETIPARLEAIEDHAGDLGRLARDCWQRHFSPTRIFNWIVDQASRLAPSTETAFRVWRTVQFCHPKNIRPVALPATKRSAASLLSSYTHGTLP